jgi:hypothetical protein
VENYRTSTMVFNNGVGSTPLMLSVAIPYLR